MTGEQPPILRPAPKGIADVVTQWLIGKLPVVFAVLRRFWPIAHVGTMYIVTRYDDVREVFLCDADFPVPYKDKLDVIMGGEPFFLGMRDTPEYRRDTSAMRMAMRREDVVPRLGPAALRQAQGIVAAGLKDGRSGRLEVVDALARTVTFEVLCDYFGVSAPADGDLRVWATRLFEFQFADSGNDPALRQEVDQIAPALRKHIDGLIAQRKALLAAGQDNPDDVLGRCLTYQAQGLAGFSDVQIRCALIGFIVGGLPQPPMVVPQALEQLLRRPQALAAAQRAARSDDDALLAAYVFEALRFDPLAPGLLRDTAQKHTVATGTPRETTIPAGARVLAAFSSAMMDERRVAHPQLFDATRPASDYMHFGHGLHTCFGSAINQVIIPQMLKPLLQKPGLKRAGGAAGHLAKEGPFASSLWVEYGA